MDSPHRVLCLTVALLHIYLTVHSSRRTTWMVWVTHLMWCPLVLSTAAAREQVCAVWKMHGLVLQCGGDVAAPVHVIGCLLGISTQAGELNTCHRAMGTWLTFCSVHTSTRHTASHCAPPRQACLVRTCWPCMTPTLSVTRPSQSWAPASARSSCRCAVGVVG